MRTWETPRLTMRRVVAADYEPFCELYADPERMRYIGTGGPRTRSETRGALDAMLRHWTLFGFGRWIMLDKADGSWVGRVGVSYLPGAEDVELGYIIRKGYEGRGLTTEACRVVLDYAFGELDRPRVIAIAYPENLGSRRVMEKLGMRFERYGPAFGTEVVWYAITRDEWKDSGRRHAN
jgi:ribosomal-protein-alanine N-acetyltransferase